MAESGAQGRLWRWRGLHVGVARVPGIRQHSQGSVSGRLNHAWWPGTWREPCPWSPPTSSLGVASMSKVRHCNARGCCGRGREAKVRHPVLAHPGLLPREPRGTRLFWVSGAKLEHRQPRVVPCIQPEVIQPCRGSRLPPRGAAAVSTSPEAAGQPGRWQWEHGTALQCVPLQLPHCKAAAGHRSVHFPHRPGASSKATLLLF